MRRALVIGSINIDRVYELEHIVRPGETVSSRKYRTAWGGKGLNQAIALSRGGAETALVNLLRTMDSARFDVDLLIFDMIGLPGSLSLIPEIPDWVHVINVAENEKKTAFVKKAVFKLERKLTGTQPFRRGAIRYLQNQYYDAAISYGEWFSSALCARYAAARRK